MVSCFSFDRGAYSSPTLAKPATPLCTCQMGTPRCASHSHPTSLKKGVAYHEAVSLSKKDLLLFSFYGSKIHFPVFLI